MSLERWETAGKLDPIAPTASQVSEHVTLYDVLGFLVDKAVWKNEGEYRAMKEAVKRARDLAIFGNAAETSERKPR